MNVHRFDEEQRRHWVELKRSGERSVRQILKEAGIARATLYNWIAEFPEPEAAPDASEELAGDAPALPSLEAVRTTRSGGARHRMLQAALAEADPTGAVRQAVVRSLVRRHTMSVPQACEIAGLSFDAYGYRPRKPEADDRSVYEELCRLLEEDGSRSFDALIVLLRSSEPGWPRKQIRRIYKEGRLYQRRARPLRSRPEPAPGDAPQTVPAVQRPWRPEAVWTAGMTTVEGRPVLFALDAEDGQPLGGAAILAEGDAAAAEAAMLEFLATTAAAVGGPRKLRVPGAAPFSSRELLRWAMQNRVALQTLSLGKEENAAEFSALEAGVASALSGTGSFDAAVVRWTALRTPAGD